MPLQLPSRRRRHTRETVIISALHNGNVRRALELLLEAYQEEIYGYCARLVGHQDAPTVYQQVLTAAVEDLSGRSSDLSLRAWIYRIARDVVTHRHRLQPLGRRNVLHPDYVPVEGPADQRLGSEDPEVDAGLAVLDPMHREILQLALWHGLSLSDIAGMTDRDPDEVRMIASAALARMALGAQDVGDAPS